MFPPLKASGRITMKNTGVTENQRKIYEYLVSQAGKSIPPTIREIVKATGIKSTSTVQLALKKLDEMGYISRNAGCSRGIKISESAESSMVPLVGKVAAGKPILAIEHIEDYIPYPSGSAEGLFALKVTGLSMINAGILDGDIVVADKNSPCKRGDIVIGMDGDEATVKRLEFEGDRVVFLPENPDFEPIYPKEPRVLGRVIGCFRRY